MGLQYIVKPEEADSYLVSKWEDSQKPTAVYKVKPGFRGLLECNCPARVTCKHIKLVVRFIRGDRRMFYDFTPLLKPQPPKFVPIKEAEAIAKTAKGTDKDVVLYNVSIAIKFKIIAQ